MKVHCHECNEVLYLGIEFEEFACSKCGRIHWIEVESKDPKLEKELHAELEALNKHALAEPPGGGDGNAR